ncbi:hypothetical protein [Candidatus Uabimicrobium sp. HlEnr_7]|uniref:hypothetical protein n=1 Tax=Candidatus Uabimicrobium helgolandensis TaxID=3095367 RepID=UPI003557B560
MDEKKKSIFGSVNRKQLSNALKKKPTSLPIKSSAEKLASINSNFPKAPKTAALPKKTRVVEQNPAPKNKVVPPNQKTPISFSSQKINFGASKNTSNPIINQKKTNIKPQPPQKNSQQRINQPIRQVNSRTNIKPQSPQRINQPIKQVNSKTNIKQQRINQPVRQVNSKIEKFTKKNKYQDQKLYDIKDRKIQGCGEKYQDQKLYDIKDRKIQGCGEKYQDQKLYDIKDRKIQGCGEKYQDQKLYNIKEHKVQSGGKKYQDHRLT